MVKKTRTKYLLNTIKKNGVTFFAVALIAATSIAIYLGLLSGADAILKEVDHYFSQNQLAATEVTCANGITQEDMETLAEQSGADVVEGGYRTMVMYDNQHEKLTIQVRSLLIEMNQAVVLEGELPKADNEVAVESLFAKAQGISVGDEIVVEHDGELVSDQFKVTAIINEPSFSCADVEDTRGRSEAGIGSAAYYFEVTKEAFDPSYYDDCYTVAYIKNHKLSDLYYYSQEYADEEAVLKEQMEAFGEERAMLRYESLVQRAEDEIADAEIKLADAKTEYSDSEWEWNDSREELENKEAELKDVLTEIQSNLKMFHLSEDLEEAQTELKAMGAAGAELSNAITEYQNGIVKLEDGKKELEEAEQELADAKLEISDAQVELDDAKETAGDISLKNWIVSARSSMGDVRAIDAVVDGVYGLSYSLALIFLMVAIVVCYASIVRMIDDQKILIGAQKALGFHTKEILAHYLKYNTLCAVFGVILGCVGGVIIVENLILYVCGKQMLLGRIPLSFVWKEAGFVAILSLVIFLAATCAGCLKAVSQPAITLLRGEAAVQKKAYFFEDWAIYRKMNLYSRTMIKNVLGDKGRILTTIMGVVGCMSLLVITFTMKFALMDAADKQYGNYFLYENWLVIDSEVGKTEDFEEILKKEGISFSNVQDKLKNFRSEGEEWDNVHVMAVETPEQLEDFVYLEDITSGKETALSENGVLISRKCAENYDLSKGSVIELMDSQGNPKECTIEGVIEHYLPYHLIITTADYYEKVMGEEADLSVFLLKGNVEGLYEKVKDTEGFLAIKKKNDDPYKNVSSSLNMVIAICLTFSAVLAVLVLMNQITMYINRKAKELSVMRINGYTLKETKSFVSKDNVVLTAMGLILGCAVGIPIAYFEVRIIESTTGPNHYVRTPNMFACALAIIVCIIFAWVVNKIALRKVDHLSLTNVNGN